MILAWIAKGIDIENHADSDTSSDIEIMRTRKECNNYTTVYIVEGRQTF